MYYLFAIPLVLLALHPMAAVGSLLVVFAVLVGWAAASDNRRWKQRERERRERLASDATMQHRAMIWGNERYGVHGRFLPVSEDASEDTADAGDAPQDAAQAGAFTPPAARLAADQEW